MQMAGGGDVIAARVRILSRAALLEQKIITALFVGAHHPDMGSAVKVPVPVHQRPLPHHSRRISLLVPHIKKLHGPPVQHGLPQLIPLIGQFQREERRILL